MKAKYGKVWEEAVLAELEAHGNRILQECVAERTYTHRTYNLYDSYGYGVYHNGRLRRIGYLNASATATETKEWYGEKMLGRDEIERFLRSEHKPQGKGIELVIAAAMPYGKALEEASSGQKRKYKVISMAYDKLVALSSQYKGSRVRALTGGKI